jgi:hypothetical protein
VNRESAHADSQCSPCPAWYPHHATANPLPSYGMTHSVPSTSHPLVILSGRPGHPGVACRPGRDSSSSPAAHNPPGPPPGGHVPWPGAVTVTAAGRPPQHQLGPAPVPGTTARLELGAEPAGLPAGLRPADVLVVDEVLDPVDHLVHGAIHSGRRRTPATRRPVLAATRSCTAWCARPARDDDAGRGVDPGRRDDQVGRQVPRGPPGAQGRGVGPSSAIRSARRCPLDRSEGGHVPDATHPRRRPGVGLSGLVRE